MSEGEADGGVKLDGGDVSEIDGDADRPEHRIDAPVEEQAERGVSAGVTVGEGVDVDQTVAVGVDAESVLVGVGERR